MEEEEVYIHAFLLPVVDGGIIATWTGDREREPPPPV